ncbi:MAG: GNAT family N-acetyltransferase, partial [Proteobacteria bacterium]|nr:GNAT family N-acetyltransferase [Pseudomonadota bacterium]
VFKDIAEIEENSWVNERGELRVGGDENQRFWNKLITDDWFSQAMKVNICYLDGEPVSHNLSFDTDDTRYNCDTGYDAKVAKYGVGILMGVENTKQSINAGIRYVNDSFGTESYKMQLGREKFTRLTDIIVFPPTVKGKLVFLLVKIKFFIESIKLKQKFREIKRKFSGE